VVPNDLQTLFGVYGDVVRVKIMFNKKDTALVQYTSASQARLACDLLNKTVMFGQPISVRPSKHREISMPRGSGSPDDLAAAALSADYSEQPVHRFRNMNAAVNNIKNLCAPGQVLHVSSLPEGIDEQQLRDLFGQYGQVHFLFLSTQ
jgi:RNA recognition motif-containing protein